MELFQEEKKLVREPLKVIIYLEHCKILGTIYLDLNSRLSDFINSEIEFIPVRDAVVESIEGRKWSYKVKFMNLNKNYIVSIFPESEVEGRVK